MFKFIIERTDEELVVLLANDSDEIIFDELFKRYERDVSFLVNSYYIFGYSPEDLKSECALAFYRAIFSYDASKGVKFKTYVLKVMRNRLSTILSRVSVLFESKSKVCDLDFVLNVSCRDGDVCEKICSDEYLEHIRNNIIGDDKEDLLLFSAVIGETSYSDLIKSGGCSGNVYYKASKLISKIRGRINKKDLE